jgi:hypothetical protein
MNYSTFFYHHQFPGNKLSGRRSVLEYRPEAGIGMGAELHVMVAALLVAQNLSAILVTPLFSVHRHIFEPIHDDVSARGSSVGAFGNFLCRFSADADHCSLHHLVERVLPFSQTDRFATLCAAMQFLARPRAVHAARVEQTMRALNLTTNEYTFLHVRHGDKGVEAPLIPARAYVQRMLQSPIPRMGSMVYVASDDPAVLPELVSAYGWAFRFVQAPGTRTNRPWQHDPEWSSALAVTELLIGASARVWVGTLSSSFGRAALMLRTAQNGGTPPQWISLDRWATCALMPQPPPELRAYEIPYLSNK